MRLHTLGTIVRGFAYWSSAAFCTHMKIISQKRLYLGPESLQPFPFLTSLRHDKGDTTESDRKLLCWEIDCASATYRQSRKFVSKSLDVNWSKKTNARSEKVPGLHEQVHKAITTEAWRHCRISIAEMQICLQALYFLSAYNTMHTTESAHISSYYAKTLLRNSHTLNIATIRTRASV